MDEKDVSQGISTLIIISISIIMWGFVTIFKVVVIISLLSNILKKIRSLRSLMSLKSLIILKNLNLFIRLTRR